MQFRVVFGFRFRDSGWSETHYWEGDNLDNATLAAASLAISRMSLSPASVVMNQCRISVFGQRRNFINPSFIGTGIPGTFVIDGIAAKINHPNDALLIEHTAINPRQKNRTYLRGIPDAIEEESDFVNANAWNTAFQGAGGYTTIVGNGSWLAKNKPFVAGVGGWVFSPIVQTRKVRMVTRRVGRPFGLPRGRRRTRTSA